MVWHGICGFFCSIAISQQHANSFQNAINLRLYCCPVYKYAPNQCEAVFPSSKEIIQLLLVLYLWLCQEVPYSVDIVVLPECFWIHMWSWRPDFCMFIPSWWHNSQGWGVIIFLPQSIWLLFCQPTLFLQFKQDSFQMILLLFLIYCIYCCAFAFQWCFCVSWFSGYVQTCMCAHIHMYMHIEESISDTT